MDTTNLKQMLKACNLAKRILERMPQLPPGMKPRHLHVLEAIYERETASLPCRVSDVSAALNVTTPSVTKLLQELEALGLICKYEDTADKRVSLLRLLPEGVDVVRYHVLEVHQKWVAALDDVSNEQVQQAVWLLHRMAETMPGGEPFFRRDRSRQPQ